MITKYTTISEMKNLKHGDLFWVNGEMHKAIGDAHISDDSTCEEYIVYDENGESWFESDFESTKCVEIRYQRGQNTF